MAIITNYLLFNHTYLRHLQAEGSVDEAAALAAQGVREWYAYRDTSSTQTLVDSWVQPLLQILELELQPLDMVGGHGDAAPARGEDGPQIHLLYTAWDQETPVGLCYVTPPGANLDSTIKGRHWMAQAVLAAHGWRPSPAPTEEGETEEGPEMIPRWVVLTNGDQWRLLDAQALRRYEAYLQVDLDELVQDPSELSALRVFYRCFHRTAFTPTPPSPSKGEGMAGLERLLAASGQATQQAEDHLKARVSHNEGIMAQLCLGLVEATGKSHFTEAERDAIYQDATYLLYRMLFILYAEARGLLPMDNPAYHAASLNGLVDTAYEYKLHGMPDPQATTLWERLRRLCGAIYESDVALGIPAYNGGLFDDADKPHLRAGHIVDAHLSQALFDLAYQPAADGYQRIDYRDLSVRHLGSLYEGMIEYKLQIAEETLWGRRDGKGNIHFLRTGQEGAPRRTDEEIKPGGVYFSQSPGERRATGTYYTPEYIVDYIVRQTVGRGLAERRTPLDNKMEAWLAEIATTTDPAEQARMQRAADQQLLRFVEEEALTFRTCDPAMGSGHFLVNAAHQMSNFIVETLHLTPWANAAIDADPSAWRRRVVERCLYGVDLSLMAVELAKLSLWLASVAQGRPLSFLDHHLRRGNSLMGVWLKDLATILAGVGYPSSSREKRKGKEPVQLTMLEHPVFRQHVLAATDVLSQISLRMAETVEDVKAQVTDYEKVRFELEPYRQLANLNVARHLGIGMDNRQLQAIAKYLINGAVGPLPEYQRSITATKKLADDRYFFHWELEFPEVFLGQSSQVLEDKAGFDATIGNPPYMSMEDMEPVGRSYYYSLIGGRPVYESANDKSNLYAIFWEQSIKLTSRNGVVSLITPYSWLSNSSFRTLRELFLRELSIHEITLLPIGVFDAGIATSILVANTTPTGDPIVTRDLRSFDISQLELQLRRCHSGREIPVEAFEDSEDYIFNLEWQSSKATIVKKMHQAGIAIGDLFLVDLGVKSANDQRYVGDIFDPELNPKKLLAGKDFGRHSYYWSGLYVYYLPEQMLRERPTARPGEAERFEKDEKIIPLCANMSETTLPRKLESSII